MLRNRTERSRAPGGHWLPGLELLQMLVCSVVAVALCFTFVGRVVGVSGASMEPTLCQRERLLVVSTHLHTPQQGDVVVLRKDSFAHEAIIKRVIATEGQRVDIDFASGTVSVDGVVLEEPYVMEPTVDAGDVSFPLTVESGCVFVLGDHRSESTDSRWSYLGQVDRRCILGTAVWLLLPGDGDWKRIGGVK